MSTIEIVPTNTCPMDFPELSRRSEVFSSFAPQVHLDIDDALFAPVLSWPYHDGQWTELEEMASKKQLLPYSDTMKYETHLMVQEPLRIGELLSEAGCSRVMAHIEVFRDAQSVRTAFAAWKSAGASEVGLAILIDTPLSNVEPFISECNSILMMSIPTLGKQGAPFDARIFNRVEALHTKYPNVTIAVDGGVSSENIAELVRAGARRFGIGSAITKTPDPAAAYSQLLSTATTAV